MLVTSKTEDGIFVSLVLFFLLSGCHSSPESDGLIVIDGFTMGTSYTVKINEPKLTISGQELRHSISLILKQANNEMSTYLVNSRLSQINQNRTTEWQELTPDLHSVISQALYIAILSNGSFDITIGPLVNLWGFGPGRKPEKIPSDKHIELATKDTGFHHIQLSSAPYLIKKDIKNLYLDLSGIAKGYAVDMLASYLESLNVKNYMVEIGGEIRSRGRNNNGNIWRIGIEQPASGQRQVQEIIQLENMSMATSGDYRNYLEENGIRYSHTINPATGRPVTHNLTSVTVLHRSTSLADGLATAMLVLGLKPGYELAIRENIAAQFIYKTDNGFQEKMTPQFRNYMMDN